MAVGTVYLVGGGPGDPGLLTLRGAECLRRADYVLYDGLVNPHLLRHTSADCERTSRVGGPESRHLNQEEINQRLIDVAQQGKTVVRLKGGDPFIFGRGSEEAAALEAAGVPYEVVPGITAATAAAVYAGISLTHRDHASAVAFVTGHEDPTKPESALPYEQLARFPGTLVFYMGLHQLPKIATRLREHGKPASTPVAVICQATRPRQRVVTGTLDDIAVRAQAASLHAPSLIVVGDCVLQREQINWFERRPLLGVRIGIPRAEDQFWDLVDRGTELGAELIQMPVIEIQPAADRSDLDDALRQIETFDWLVFTSVNGVTSFLGRLWESGGDARRLCGVRIAAIGPSTAAELEKHRLRADLIPANYRSEDLAAAMAPLAVGKKVLCVRASRGRDVLPQNLSAAGAIVRQVVAYQNLDCPDWSPEIRRRIRARELDWIALSSPAIARRVASLIPPDERHVFGEGGIRIAAISPVTAEAAADSGLPVHAVARTYDWNGLFACIAEDQPPR
jgi:uroporphyrinogen III methyltransferase/synthase